MKSNFISLLFNIMFSLRVKMSWNNGDNKNLFLKLKSKLGHYHVAHTTTKTSPKKLTLTAFEMQHLPDIDKTDSFQRRNILPKSDKI